MPFSIKFLGPELGPDKNGRVWLKSEDTIQQNWRGSPKGRTWIAFLWIQSTILIFKNPKDCPLWDQDHQTGWRSELSASSVPAEFYHVLYYFSGARPRQQFMRNWMIRSSKLWPVMADFIWRIPDFNWYSRFVCRCTLPCDFAVPLTKELEMLSSSLSLLAWWLTWPTEFTDDQASLLEDDRHEKQHSTIQLLKRRPFQVSWQPAIPKHVGEASQGQWSLLVTLQLDPHWKQQAVTPGL